MCTDVGGDARAGGVRRQANTGEAEDQQRDSTFDLQLQIFVMGVVEQHIASGLLVDEHGVGKGAGVLKMLALANVMALLPAAVLPDHVVSPAFTVRPPVICLPAAPLMLSELAKVVVPAPKIVPPLQVEGPATANVPVPPKVPPDSSRLPIDEACAF